jgi:uncharacterized protein YutD
MFNYTAWSILNILPPNIQAPQIHVRLGTDNAKSAQKPEKYTNRYRDIHDHFDFHINGDVGIDKPQHNPNRGKSEKH